MLEQLLMPVLLSTTGAITLGPLYAGSLVEKLQRRRLPSTDLRISHLSKRDQKTAKYKANIRRTNRALARQRSHQHTYTWPDGSTGHSISWASHDANLKERALAEAESERRRLRDQEFKEDMEQRAEAFREAKVRALVAGKPRDEWPKWSQFAPQDWLYR